MSLCATATPAGPAPHPVVGLEGAGNPADGSEATRRYSKVGGRSPSHIRYPPRKRCMDPDKRVV